MPLMPFRPERPRAPAAAPTVGPASTAATSGSAPSAAAASASAAPPKSGHPLPAQPPGQHPRQQPVALRHAPSAAGPSVLGGLSEESGAGNRGAASISGATASGESSGKDPGNTARWGRALAKAPTTGASAVTAKQDGLLPGIDASRTMARTDLARVLRIADVLREVGAALDVPPAIIAALASRESRCGAVLDANGFGDHEQAFGILQVDKRFHTLQGVSDGPAGRAHLEQAVGIFAAFRKQLQTKHSDWEDEFILKAAAVAYNAGVKNVQTKQGLDQGTTGNDYGSDVIARAQFYADKL